MRWILNIATNYTRFLINIILVLLLTPFIISKIGMEMFGLWALVFSVIGIFGLLDFGFSTAGVKYVAECVGKGDHEHRNRLVSTLFFLYLGIGLVCSAVVLSVAYFGGVLFDLSTVQQQAFTGMVLWLGASLCLAFPSSVFKSSVNGSGYMMIANGVELSMRLLNAGLVVYVLNHGYGVLGMAASAAVTMLGETLLLAPFAYHLLPEFRISWRLFSMQEVRELMSFSIYAFVANIAMLLILRVDPLVIKSFMSLRDVAVYAIAAKIAEYTYMLNKQISNALMPLVSQSHGGGDGATIRRILLDGTRFLMGIALPFVALLYFYAPELIHVWVGDDFKESVDLLRVLLFAALFSILQQNAATVVAMVYSIRYIAFALLASAVVNVLLSVVLIQVYGLPGVALGSLIAAFCVELFVIIPKACRVESVRLGSFFLHGFAYALLPLLPMFAVAFGLHAQWPVDSLLLLLGEAACSGVVYLCFFYLWVVKKEEKQLLKAKIASFRQARAAP